MVIVLLVSILFRGPHLLVNGYCLTSFHTFSGTPYLLLIGARAVSVGGEELKWCQVAHHQLVSQPRGPHFSLHRTKAQISGRMVSSGISDETFASVCL